jgi:hypothetical protein
MWLALLALLLCFTAGGVVQARQSSFLKLGTT